MEVRELKAKDLKTLVKMLGKLTPSARTEIASLLKEGKRTKQDTLTIGLGIFQILATLTDDIYVWLADMAGIKPEELDNMPVSAPVDIIKQIFSQGDLQSFFGSAVQSIDKK